VLVVVLDDVGVEQLEPWGLAPQPARTPTIDCLCERGLRFSQAWASPSCSPTRSELLTGHYNRRTGVGTIFTPDDPLVELSTDFDSLADVGRRAGYATGLFGKWHLAEPTSPGAATHPNRSGFDRFAGSLANLNTSTDGHVGNGYGGWQRIVDGVPGRTEVYPTTATVDDALDFVAEVGDQPWLVVLSFHAPHVPFHWPPARLWGPQPWGVTFDQRRYLAMLEAVDTELGRFLRSLPDQQRADTHVIVMGDNGTVGEVIPEPLPPVGKTTLNELGVRVPMVISGPAVERPGEVSDALVHVVDVLPTVADRLGVEHEALDGRSWGPVFLDPDAEVHETVASSRYFPLGLGEPSTLDATIRDATHKLVRHSDGVEELFEVGPDRLVEGPDLLDGPLTPEEEARLEALRAELEALDASVAEDWPDEVARP
jgi:arylsulfatase A-like enzyme